MSIPYATIDTVFLDAGNTVLYLNHPLIQEGLADLGVAVDLDTLERAEARARVILDAHIAAHQGSTETEDTQLFWIRNILDALGVPLDSAALAPPFLAWVKSPDVWPRIWNHVPDFVPVALATLRDLGLRLYVVSNSDGTVSARFERAGLADFFEGVVDSAIVGVEKPDPEIFRHALRLSGADPRRVLHVGDVYSVDVLGARSAGLHAALIDPFGDWTDVDCEKATNIVELSRKFERARRESPRTETP